MQQQTRGAHQHNVDTIMEEVTDRLPISSMVGTLLGHDSSAVVLEKDEMAGAGAGAGANATIVLNHKANEHPKKLKQNRTRKGKKFRSQTRGVLPNDHPVESDLTSAIVVFEKDETTGANVNVGLSHELAEKPEETKNMLVTNAAKDEMVGSTINLDHKVNEKHEETTMHIAKTNSNKRKRKRRSRNPESALESLTQETKNLVNTNAIVLEKNEMGGLAISLNHKVNEEPEETTHIVKTNSKKRNRKARSRNAKCAMQSMTEKMTESSSQEIVIKFMGVTSLLHDSDSIPETDVLKAVQTNDRPVQLNITTILCEKCHLSPVDTTMSVFGKEEPAGMNLDPSHEVNEKPEETEHVLSKKRGKKRRRLSSKHRAKCRAEEKPAGVYVDLSHEANEKTEETKYALSSECRAKSMSEEIHDNSSQRLPSSSIERASLDNESVKPVLDVSEIISLSDIKNDVSVVVANAPQVESDLTDACGKCPTSPLGTTMAVLKNIENDVVSAVVANALHTESDLTNACEKHPISPVDTTMAVSKNMENDVVSAAVVNAPQGESDLTNAYPISPVDTTMAVLENDETTGVVLDKDEVDGANSSFSKCGVKSTTEDAINTSLLVSQPSNTSILKFRRKLLVLDVNGLLVDIVVQCPKRLIPVMKLAGKKVFKRPFCDDFLRFCFEKFDVGIWTSRTKKNVTRVLDLLMTDTKDKLLFCWDQSHCTVTGFETRGRKKKPLVLKELKHLWENEGNDCPWPRGFYNESNTILLDDSPYKALRNPPYTGVFPHPYSIEQKQDESLGPNGDLRLYLERLAEAENVQNFIQANPFGQEALSEGVRGWGYYSQIVGQDAPQQDGNSLVDQNKRKHGISLDKNKNKNKNKNKRKQAGRVIQKKPRKQGIRNTSSRAVIPCGMHTVF